MYADESYYNDTYNGSAIPADDLSKALDIASEVIDDLTHHRIEDVDDLTVYQLAQVQKACCIIAEDAYAGGALSQGATITGGFSLGDFSVSAPAGIVMSCGVQVSGRALTALRASGLMYAGVS